MRKYFSVLILALASVAFAQSESLTAQLMLPSEIKDSLPWFAVREINEASSPFTKVFLSREAAKAERTALVFFATWCNPCKAGIKRLANAQAELKEHKVNVILVNIGVREVEEKKIRSWVNSIGAGSFKLIIDPFKVMTEGFGLVGKSGEIALPKTLVVDQKMKPVKLLGQEGSDWPQILWED